MPPITFSRSVDIRLIQLVKDHPVLYNPRHPKYTDSDTREVTWQKIGDSLNRPAVVFAGIQCQIHYGDFQEDKHKPGFIEDLKEFLPEQYRNGWGVEKKVLKEYRKHQGLSELDAKHLYTKTARALPTYGVTFFLVKEKQKDKKKLVPRLLGINAESILRLDETSKEVLQTWPLTHVKTYHAAQGEIFTLNFGDYSQKDYSVKTRDAYRIRDILEDYIDIIRKRMLAQYNIHNAESAYIEQDNVTSSTASTVQHISNNPAKLIEHCYVGPSKIVPFESGKEMCQGTQIVTVQQIVVSDRVARNQQGAKGEVAMRGDMSMPFTRRLNRLNSNSVQIVTLLTEPTETHVEDAKKIVEKMNADMPFIREGVQETIERQTSDEEKKKLHDQMMELDELMRSLTRDTAPPTLNVSQAADAAMKTADLTTQMYFSLDSGTKRRSRIISRSRKSFIEDDNTQRNVRKASFIAASTTALHSVDEARHALDEKCPGLALNPQRTAELEATLLDKLAKLNAAMAHYVTAHSDPDNVDYEAAVVSMHTIKDLMPDFAKDVQELASASPSAQREILMDAKTLCDAVKKICSAAGLADREKMDEACGTYAEASGRLVFTFGKGRNSDKENELLDLADEVGAKTSLLLMSAQEMTQLAPSEPAAVDVDAAGVKAAVAAKDLISRVQMTAPTIHEPHCQSAVTAAAEALSGSVQRLALAWRPLLEPPGRRALGERAHAQSMQLAEALDRLRAAYRGLEGDEDGDVFAGHPEGSEGQRLKFINTLSANKKRWQQLDEQLDEPTAAESAADAEEAQRRLAERLARLNAAMAALLSATADREQQDYVAAEEAIRTINELMPLVIQDSKMCSGNQDADARAAMAERIRLLCEASRGICTSVDQTTPEDRSEAIAKFRDASGKLVFGISHRGSPHKENQILDLSEQACQQTSQLLSGVQQLSERVGGATATELDARGAAVGGAAQGLQTTAQLTAASISSPHCRSALQAAVEALSSRGEALAAAWRPLQQDAMHKRQVQGLDTALGQLEGKLDALRDACRAADDVQATEEAPRDHQRLQFVKTMSEATKQIEHAQKALDKPLPPPLSSDKAEAVELRLSGRLGELNAAIAALLAATADPERPNYESAEEAMKTISELLPHVVQDTQSTSANKDEATRAAMLDLLRELCEASRGVCTGSGNNPQGLSDAVSKFSDASGKLVYVVNPRSDANMENQIMGLSSGACNKASQLLAGVQQLAEGVAGERGVALDARGAAVADAAQGLITCAKITAPSISEPHCKQAMLSSVDKVSSSAQDLEKCWLPLLKDPQHQQQAASLETPYKQLESQLDALKKACLLADVKTPREAPHEQQRLQFVKTMSGATKQIEHAQKALDKPLPPPLSSDKAEAVELRLSGRLGELNAAIAALLAATADRERLDYESAEEAMKNISELLPRVVQDTQSTSANKDEATRAAMLDLLRELCEASRGVCAGSGNNPQGLTDAVSKFSDASGKLVYVVNPRSDANMENQIMGLSSGACNKASQLLAGVQQLAEGVAGERGVALDTRGAAVADAAQGLITCAKITAPSISEPHCKQAMLSSVDKVSSSAQDLEKCWLPLLKDPQHQQQAASLETPYKQLETQLEALKKACLLAVAVKTPREAPREQQRLQFVKTMSRASEQIQQAQKALDKPLPPPLSSDRAEAVELRLSGRLGELNAAIAALLAATANRENPDYKTAEQALETISELMPHVVQETQLTSANKDEATRAAMLDLLRELCEASRGVCAGSGGNSQGLNDAVSKFSNASGKLVYVVSPRVNADREKQIIGVSGSTCDAASRLLRGVQQVAAGVRGERAAELDTRGSTLADAAQELLHTAQVTAPSISEPHCKQAMLSSVDKVSSTAQDLEKCWLPLLKDPQHQQQAAALDIPYKQLEEQLEALKKACSLADEVQTPREMPREQQKLQFVKTVSRASEQIQQAQKALNKPLPPPLSSDKAEAVELRLSGRLGELNAAIAALLAATANRENPDYLKADKAVETITELLPHVVQDTQTSCATKEPEARAAMLDHIRKLCEASAVLCATPHATNPQGIRDAVDKFSVASGGLGAAVSASGMDRRALREEQLVELGARAQCCAASLAGELQAARLPAQHGAELARWGSLVADAANTLLATTKVTAPTISDPHCAAALSSSVEQLAAYNEEFERACEMATGDPGFREQGGELLQRCRDLLLPIDALRRVCKTQDLDAQLAEEVRNMQKLQFIKTKSRAEEQIQKTQTALDKPLPPPLSSDKAEAVELRLSGRLGELNAAIAALLAATANREKPNYKTADESVKTITELLPHIVQDTQSTSANKDEATRAAMLDLLRELCEASRGVCAGSDTADTQGLSEAVGQFAGAAGKLVYTVSPRVNAAREQKIMQLSAAACNDTSQLLSAVQQLSTAVGGERGVQLDARGAGVADAAQALLASAQVTAASISEPHCKTSLLFAADSLSSRGRELEACWRPLAEDPRHKQRVPALQQALQQLEAQLAALRKACNTPDQVSAPAKKTPPPPPVRSTPLSPRSTIGPNSSGKRSADATKEFLDRLRCEEGQTPKTATCSKSTEQPKPPHAKTDDEKRMHQQFLQSVDGAEKTIKKAKEQLLQASKAGSTGPAISVGDCLAKQARLQRDIALAGVHVAALVSANYADTIDYATATKSTDALPQLMSSIVEDGKLLSSTVNEEARKAFLEDMLQMCSSTTKLCDAAKNDREKLNDAAVEFGDNSAKLLYVVSNDVDPTLEKEIITRAKAIGDSVAQISVGAGEVAGGACGTGGPAAVEALCAAGARCQDGAGKLLYTAKLVAPSIYEAPCQEALHASADSLATDLRAFTHSWKPFTTDPQHATTIKELGKEAENVERIIECLKSDVKGGRIGQRREIERLVVEDTPMRTLTLRIMEDAKKLSEWSDLSPALRREYQDYCKRLGDALRSLDLANARCKRTPHDTNKRRDLENAIQNLQMILLQSRPSRSDKQKSNIVDLRDFIDEVSAEADKLADATNGLKVPTAADKKTLQAIQANGEKISKAAYKLTHTDEASGFDTNFQDILDVDQFGQECDEVIADINAQLKSIEDAKARSLMCSKILPLAESCNMLRFATKSGISAEKSASLESTLDDLDDVESRVIKSIVRDAAETAGVTLRFAPSPPAAGDALAGCKLSRAVCAAGAPPRAPLTAYIASCAAATDTSAPDTRNRLLRHLYKLVHLLKMQTVTTSKRIATWQPIDDPEVATITEQILKEIQNPESKFQPESTKVKKILNDSDLSQLLVPGPAKVVGDKRQQDDKLTQLSTKLNSMCSALTLSVGSPESLCRSAHAASGAAVELAAVARGCKDAKDPVRAEWVEEAVNEMTFCTYNLLKTAEISCQDPNNTSSKRRLLDACRSLNVAIDKLVRVSSSASPLAQECGSLARALALAQAACPAEPVPTSALPYDQCCEALNDQQELVYKLKSDQPMSRQEFARSLHEVNEAVVKTTEISTQCAYLISVSEKDSEIAKKGPVDVPRIQRSIEALQDSCMAVIGAATVQQAKDDTEDLKKRIDDFSRALDDAQLKVKDGGAKATLTRAKAGVVTSAAGLSDALSEQKDMDKVTGSAVELLGEVNRAHSLVERCPLVPSSKDMSAAARAQCDDIANNSKTLLSNTMALVKEVGRDESETLTWVTFSATKTKLLDAYDALMRSIRTNGQRAGILEGSPEEDIDETDAQSKTYLEVQVELANKWLCRPMCKADVKTTGQQAVRHVIDIATKMCEELKGSEREELRGVIVEAEELLAQCTVRYDHEKYSVLTDRIKELKKAVQRGVVTRVVEDFMHDHPLDDLDLVLDAEQDEQKRKFLLERKIAELLAQLGRVARTARFVADAGGSQKHSAELLQCSEQTELLAPMLVQAAQDRITEPNDQAAIEKYKSLLAKYAESISKVRALCDRAVDPMDFVQTAGDTMQRMREESSAHNDVQKGHQTSEAMLKLGNRLIEVSMSSSAVRRNPEVIAELQAAQQRILAATPAAGCRPSRLPDWKETTAEVLRTTGEVESALGGENIFKKQPTANGANQQIYSVARDLHESVREWSSRDNEIVGVARRVAVLMARLSEYMETDKKQALISTSRSIVLESREVAELAKKLAHECTDLRIKNNLLQTCERIPTISAQLKMLTTVKGSSLGHQGSAEDKEAMDMLVGNAQSLMISIQEVVKAAAGASVKIMSQRGPRLRWVRKNYY